MADRTHLVIAAHPDDEVLGCGGTIAKLAAVPEAVHVAILGEGITSRYDDRDDAEQILIEALHERAREVASFLGASEVYLQKLPDNRFDSIDLLDIVKTVEELVDASNPDVIYTHSGSDLNVDHRIVQQAVLTATRPQADNSVKDIYGFEVPSSTEWAFGEMNGTFDPKRFVDISGTIETKIEAMEMYESEARKFPHPRSPEAVRSLAKRRGSQSGFSAAEASEPVRILG